MASEKARKVWAMRSRASRSIFRWAEEAEEEEGRAETFLVEMLDISLIDHIDINKIVQEVKHG